jgi:predicted alpha/beta superfamily hydrolase
MYSAGIRDSFTIFISLPEHYDARKTYPVVYLLDANLYFDMMATVLKKYSEVGLQPAILVGIGYKDLMTMDSLRDRDYTYPLAEKTKDMPLSGNADKLLSFICNDVIPQVERNYTGDTTNRILMGHSLGGYFVSYALLQHLSGKASSFQTFVAASPSLSYNHAYVLQQLATLPVSKQEGIRCKMYVTYGGLEDAEDADDTTELKTAQALEALSQLLGVRHAKAVEYKGEVYSNLSHMDMPLPSFLKGYEWVVQH